MLAIRQAQHLAQSLVDVDDTVVAARREEADRRIFNIERTCIDGPARDHACILDLAQAP